MKKSIVLSIALLVLMAFFVETKASAQGSFTGNVIGNIIPLLVLKEEEKRISGSLKISLSPLSPPEKWYVSEEEGINSVFRFTASIEDFSVQEIPLALFRGSPADIAKISLYQGNTLIWEKFSPAFAENGIQRVFLSLGQLVVPKGDDGIDLTIVVKFSQIGTGLPGTSGNLIRVVIAEPFPAVGMDSGIQILAQGYPATPSGARYFKALPEVNFVPLTNYVLSNGTKTLYRYSVSAFGGDIDLYKMMYYINTNVGVSYCSVVEEETGRVVTNTLSPNQYGLLSISPVYWKYGSEIITIPAGQTYTYALSCTVTGASSGGYISTVLLGDNAFYRGDLGSLKFSGYKAFIWSDRSDPNHTTLTEDWYNGFKIPGLPTTNLTEAVLSL